MNEERRGLTAVLSPSWAAMADCYFQYLPCRGMRNGASATNERTNERTNMDRISSFRRFSSVPLISIFLPVAGLPGRSAILVGRRAAPRYIRLYRFRQLQQLREIMEKPCSGAEITDVLPACEAKIETRRVVVVDDGRRRRFP